MDGESLRVAAGEAVLWPADVPHAAWAEHGNMRAFVVEFAGPDDRGLIEGAMARAIGPGEEHAGRGEGSLRGDGPEPLPDPEAGEPH